MVIINPAGKKKYEIVLYAKGISQFKFKFIFMQHHNLNIKKDLMIIISGI